MRLEVTTLDEVPRDHGMRVQVGEHRIAMFRVGEEVFAIGDRCSHAEASLAEGEVFDGTVECPRHGSEFDLATGSPRSLPATSAVPTYQVSVENGSVFLTLEDQ